MHFTLYNLQNLCFVNFFCYYIRIFSNNVKKYSKAESGVLIVSSRIVVHDDDEDETIIYFFFIILKFK